MNEDMIQRLVEDIDEQHVDVRDVFEKLEMFRSALDSYLNQPEFQTDAEKLAGAFRAMSDAVSTYEHGGLLVAQTAIRNVVWKLIKHDRNPVVAMKTLSLKNVTLDPRTKIPLAYAFSTVAYEDSESSKDEAVTSDCVEEALKLTTAHIIGWQREWLDRYALTLKERYE